MAKEAVITGIVIGEMTEELKRVYARALARGLIAEHGKDRCKKMLEELKNTP